MSSRTKKIAVIAAGLMAIGGAAHAGPATMSCPAQHDGLALSGLLVSLGPTRGGQLMEPDKETRLGGGQTLLSWAIPAGPGTLFASCEYGPLDRHTTGHDIERALPVPGAAASCSATLHGQAVEQASCRQ